MGTQNDILDSTLHVPAIGSTVAGRFTVRKVVQKALGWALLDGVQDEPRLTVWILITNEHILIQRLQALRLASHSNPILQNALYSDFNEEKSIYYYVIAQSIHGQLKFLSDISGLQLGKKLTIAQSICDAVNQMHKSGIFFVELRPDMILVDADSGLVQKIISPSNLWMTSSPPSTLLRHERSKIQAEFNEIIDKEILQTCLYELIRTVPEAEIPAWWHIAFNVFAAPECISRQDVSAKADIFSLGAIIFWLFAENTPYQAVDLDILRHEVMPPMAFADLLLLRSAEGILLNKFVGIKEHEYSSVPAQIVPIIQKATQGNPHNRYKNVEGIIKELSRLTKRLKITVKDSKKQPVPDIPLVIKRYKNNIVYDSYNLITNKDGVYEGFFIGGEYSAESLGNDFYNKSEKKNFEISDMSKEIELDVTPLSFSENLYRRLLGFRVNFERARKPYSKSDKRTDRDSVRRKEK